MRPLGLPLSDKSPTHLDDRKFFRDAITAAPNPEPWHLLRYCLSADWIRGLLDLPEWRSFFASQHSPTNDDTTHILDIGGVSPFSAWLRTIFTVPGSVIDSYAEGWDDLRYAMPGIASNSHQLITCMEVLEHIKDRETNDPESVAMHTGSGTASLLAELYRLTVPGGYLFLTTPNAASWRSLLNIAKGNHPFQYKPHVREYTVADVRTMLTAAGWQIEHLQCFNVWSNINGPDQNRLEQFLESIGSDAVYTEDDIFVLARKETVSSGKSG